MKKHNWMSGKTHAEIGGITDRFWADLSEKAYPLTKGTMRVPISLEPFVIAKEDYQKLSEKILLVISAARKLAERYFDDPAVREVLALDAGEIDLIESSRDQSFVGIVRADLFYGAKPQIVELNADFPDGFFMHDVTAQSILDLLESGLETRSNSSLFHQLLESEGVRPDEHIFVGHDHGRTFIDEFALTQQTLNKAGWSTVSYGSFDALEHRDGRFHFEGKPVSVIRRGAETAKLRSNQKLLSRMMTQQADSRLTILNNFKMRLLGHKALLATLWDDRFHHYITADELEAVKDIIPETQKLEIMGGDAVLAEKDAWVLKPSDLAEGEGVTIGSSATQDEWAAALANALKRPQGWLLQRKVDIPKEEFSLYNSDDSRVYSERMSYDLDPHVVLFKDRAELGSILVRFSPSEILNVMKGGGLTYAFVR